MAILPIYTYDHEVLRKTMKQVEQDSAELQQLIQDMIVTMRNADGIGLAANQVGHDLSLHVIDAQHIEGVESEEAIVAINPEIIGEHGESVFEEGCLSLPGIREEIIRPAQIGVRYYDQNLKLVEREADKILARVFQHEIDHLNGKYFIDYLSPLKFSFIRGKLSKMMKGEMEADYPLAPPSSQSKKSKAPKLPRM
jgi:peptide deformylase